MPLSSFLPPASAAHRRFPSLASPPLGTPDTHRPALFHTPHTQHFVTTPKVTDRLDLAGPISQRKPGTGGPATPGGCLGQAPTAG